MMKLIQKSFPVKRISPMDEHFFFGYYDLQQVIEACSLL